MYEISHVPKDKQTRRSTLYWTVSLTCIFALVLFRVTVSYTSDNPLGIACGAGTFLMIGMAVFSGWLMKRKSRLASFARHIHCQVGAVALAIAVAHWHFRWRDYFGIATALLLVTVVLSLTWKPLRRSRAVRLIHKYGGYGLILLALVHGVRALLFSGN